MLNRRNLLLYVGSLLLASCGRPIAPRPPIAKRQGADPESLSSGDQNRSGGFDPGDAISSGTDPSAGSAPPPAEGPLELTGLSIALTVGHGQAIKGFDPGAKSGQIVEHDLNAAQATTISEILTRRGAAVKVFKYDSSHGSVSLTDRGRNASGYDIHISLHHNSFENRSVQGGETLVHPTNVTDQDKIFAKIINDSIIAATGVADRGVKSQDVTVLKATPNQVVKCLCEPFFISNASLDGPSAAKLSQQAAVAIADGVSKYWRSKTGLSIRTYAVPTVEQNDLPGLYDDHNDGSFPG